MNKLYNLFAIAGIDWLGWKALGSGGLRILSYHGVCSDELASEPWVPRHFVTRSILEKQLQYLRKHASIVPLGEGVARLRSGDLPRRAVALTFDDGYANNLYEVLPLLQKYEAPATIFVSTAYVESGDFYPFDRLRLTKIMAKDDPAIRESLVEYKNHTLDEVVGSVDLYWERLHTRLTKDQREVLRPLRLDELKKLETDLITVGAHAHNHCILGNESRKRRDQEIERSVNLIRHWMNTRDCPFSYPNGQTGDYDDADKSLLKDLNVSLAVNGIAGINNVGFDPLDLKRLPIGIYHDRPAFAAEVIGFSKLARSARFFR